MKLKKIMSKPFVCDQCGCSMVHGREIIVNDLEWERLVGLSLSKNDPKNTLLCPECIEALNGGPLDIKQLVKKKGEYEVFFPMNIWYVRKNNIEVPLRYILGHYRYFERMYRRKNFMSHFRKIWEEDKSREFE